MELWIRSQNKEKLISNCSFLIKDWGDKCWIECIIHKERLILGIYKTKERALEVLDDIQNILRPKYILDSSSIKECGNSWVENGFIMQEYNANATIQELSTYVYEMPID